MKWLCNHDLEGWKFDNKGTWEQRRQNEAHFLRGKVIGEPQSHGDMLPVEQLKKMGLVGVYVNEPSSAQDSRSEGSVPESAYGGS